MWNDRIKAPCKRDCPDRCAEPNCHMTCDIYIEYKRIVEEAKAKELAGRRKGSDARGFIAEQTRKTVKRYKR